MRLSKYRILYSAVAENWEHQHSLGTVHSCNLKQKLCEFRVSRAALKCIKVYMYIHTIFQNNKSSEAIRCC